MRSSPSPVPHQLLLHLAEARSPLTDLADEHRIEVIRRLARLLLEAGGHTAEEEDGDEA